MGSRSAFELAQFRSPFLGREQLFDIGRGHVMDTVANEALRRSAPTARKRSLAAITAPPPPATSRRRRTTSQTSQIIVPPALMQRSVNDADEFTVNAPISRDHHMATRTQPPPMFAQPQPPMQTAMMTQLHYQHPSMMPPPSSVIVEATGRHARTVPPMTRPQPMSPFMTQANHVVGKVPLFFFFVVGTLLGMLGAMLVVTSLEGGAKKSPRNSTTMSMTTSSRKPVTLHANRLFVYPLVMTTSLAPEGSSAHGRTASSRLSARDGR